MESKRARVEEAKKQRINRLRLEYEQRISAVKIAYKEYFMLMKIYGLEKMM